MKPRCLFLIVLFCAILVGCNFQNNKARVNLELINFEGDTLLISISPISLNIKEPLFDTIVLDSGKLLIDTLITEYSLVYVISKGMIEKFDNDQVHIPRAKVIRFFVGPNEKISVNVVLNQFSTDYNVEGSRINQQWSKYRMSVINDLELESTLYSELMTAYIGGEDDEKIMEIQEKFLKTNNDLNNNELNFIKQEPDLELSAYFLLNQWDETFREYYPFIGENVKQTPYGREVEKRLNRMNSVALGEDAPNFDATLLDGKPFSLSDHKGKYIVLNFWGTWCGPCIAGIPRMKEYHTKYSEHVEFVGIACRDSEENLRKAIDDYQIGWTQILNQERSVNNLALLYSVSGYPTKYIIDPDGIIQGYFLGYSDEFYQKMDEIFSE